MGELVITILGGRRPRLLERTLCSVERHSRSLLQKSRVVALINGGDGESARLVKKRNWVDELLQVGPELMPIGDAVSRLWDAADVSSSAYMMHLEDDWECTGPWFRFARTILERDERIGQVRVRRHAPQSAVGHAVMRYHMLTHRRLQWKKRKVGGVEYLASRAHFTFNPGVMKGSTAARLVPCRSEMDAAGMFHAMCCESAQVLPGAFLHLGGGDESLRARIELASTAN